MSTQFSELEPRVMRAIVEVPNSSRSQIANTIQYSTASVINSVKSLSDKLYVVEGAIVKPQKGSGRPATGLIASAEFWNRQGQVLETVNSKLTPVEKELFDEALQFKKDLLGQYSGPKTHSPYNELTGYDEGSEHPQFTEYKTSQLKRQANFIGRVSVLSDLHDINEDSMYGTWFPGTEGWNLLISSVALVTQREE